MGTFPKFKDAGLYAYNNPEFLNYVRRYRSRLPISGNNSEDDTPIEVARLNDEPQGAPALGISAEQVAELDRYIAQLTDLTRQSRISQETAPRIETDNQRDKVAVYILSSITGASSLPLQSQREAGTLLSNVAKPYIGLQRLAYNQETEVIKGLIVDLRKEENQQAVSQLGLTPYVEELERLNNLFEALTEQRTTAQINNAIDNSKILRAKIENLYEDMTDLAFAWSLAHPSETATNFIRDINALIDESQTALHRRKAAGKKKTEESDDTATDETEAAE